MRWNWPNKPRYKGQERPSDDGRFPAVGLGGGNRHELTQSSRSMEGIEGLRARTRCLGLVRRLLHCVYGNGSCWTVNADTGGATRLG
jgi:hypothetical protein